MNKPETLSMSLKGHNLVFFRYILVISREDRKKHFVGLRIQFPVLILNLGLYFSCLLNIPVSSQPQAAQAPVNEQIQAICCFFSIKEFLHHYQ